MIVWKYKYFVKCIFFSNFENHYYNHWNNLDELQWMLIISNSEYATLTVKKKKKSKTFRFIFIIIYSIILLQNLTKGCLKNKDTFFPLLFFPFLDLITTEPNLNLPLYLARTFSLPVNREKLRNLDPKDHPGN